MNSFFTVIKLDYLQRTRSYAFLITLCISLAVGYSFMPPPDANYYTISIGGYQGYYNAAWFGYATALLSSIFLSLIGFYLVNGSIKKDNDTKVGQIVAATSIKNFSYLFSKVLSNFLVLFTLMLIMFLMSILLFFQYGEGYPFELHQFVKPYVLLTLPSLFFTSVLAVVFEVFFRTYTVLQNIAFFILFSAMTSYMASRDMPFELDVFGSEIITRYMEEAAHTISKTGESSKMTIGVVIGDNPRDRKFSFNGIDFSYVFMMSRLLWILLGIGIIAMIAPFFHRFNIKERTVKKAGHIVHRQETTNEIIRSRLPVVVIHYGLFPLLKTEFLLLVRHGKKWMWILNGIGMLLLIVVPTGIAHSIILPILWFLQVGRLAELTTRETTNNVHYFAFSAYNPLRRILASQLISGIFLMQLLALPLVLKFVVTSEITTALAIVSGSIFIVLFAALLGIVTKGKKLFEILFFVIVYANINKVAFMDYFGATSTFQFTNITACAIFMLVAIFLIRNKQLQQ